MSKQYVIYNQIGIFVGPAPSNTGHFISYLGNVSNNDDSSTNFNLVFPLNRIQGINYSFSEQRTDIKSLGAWGTISRPKLIQPEVNLSFSYYLMGLVNEARLGFMVNQPSGVTGQPIYGQSLNVCPISGFIDRSYQKSNDTPLNWPLSTREPRNFFVATNQGYSDLNDYSPNTTYKSAGVDVWAFGDCFLNSYKQSAAVGQIPLVSVDYICNNIEFYNYASGTNIPSINLQNGLINSGFTYDLPNNYETTNTGLPTVILPSDISLSIHSVPSGNYLSFINNNTLSTALDAYGDEIMITEDPDTLNFPILIDDLKVQSYSFDLTLNREPMYNMGYKFPLDRRINFPVYCNLQVTANVGQDSTGSLTRFLSKDRDWDIIMKLSYQKNSPISGVGIIYQFLHSKFNSISFDDKIGKVRTANLSFTTELNPNYNTKGFFISGVLGIDGNQSIEVVLGTGIGSQANPIEIINFSQLLLSQNLAVQPLY